MAAAVDHILPPDIYFSSQIVLFPPHWSHFFSDKVNPIFFLAKIIYFYPNIPTWHNFHISNQEHLIFLYKPFQYLITTSIIGRLYWYQWDLCLSQTWQSATLISNAFTGLHFTVLIRLSTKIISWTNFFLLRCKIHFPVTLDCFWKRHQKWKREVVLTVSTARKSDTTSGQFTEGKHWKCSEVFAVSRNVKAGRRSKEWQNKERNIPACNKLEKLCQNISPGRTLYFWHLHKKNFPYSSIKMFYSFAPKCLHISAANIALVCARGFCSKTYIRAAVSKSLARKRSVIGIGKYGKVIQPESILFFKW